MIQLPSTFKLIFRCLHGSHLYGTQTPLSDIDERGVFIPDERYFYGFLNRTEQFEDKKNDITYFEIRKFMQLAINNNPNIIELLFVPKYKWLQNTVDWLQIYKNRELFLSKKCKYTFSGYAHSQFNRIKLHRSWLLNPPKKKPERKDFGLSEHRSDLTRDQIGAFNVLLALKLENIKEFHPLKEDLEIMQETKDFKALCTQFTDIDKEAVQTIIPISDSFIEILQKENGYAMAERHYNQYENWKKNRNPERAKLEENYGFDTKHGSHLVRLVTEGEELLLKGHITFPRPDAKFLLEIKNGLYKYEEISTLLESFDNKFNELYEKSPLPHSPDRVKIDELCQKIIKRFLTS
jgi:predicted nucleotidyltransferase